MNTLHETGLEFVEWLEDVTASLATDPEFERMTSRLNTDPEDLEGDHAN